jgi:predicted DNA-binding transcriptional regulator YafY
MAILREVESRRTGVTIHELANKVNVSTRTIRRDLQALQEAGFAVYDEGEENETKRWRLDTAPFRAVQEGLSVADVAALYLSRTVVEGLSGWPLAEELRAAVREDRRGAQPAHAGVPVHAAGGDFAKTGPRADSRSAAGLVGVDSASVRAARDRRIVEMRYFSASSNRAKSYTVQPYRLAWRRAAVSRRLGARVRGVPDVRCRAHRTPVGVRGHVQEDARVPADLFRSSMGVFWGEPEPIEVLFAARVAMLVRGRVWHDSQVIEDQPDGSVKMSLLVCNDAALRSWLLGFGAAVRVLQPAALAKSLAEECRGAADSIWSTNLDAPNPSNFP